MKVYTKTGDKGTTLLIGGERVSKTDSRVEAYGTVDELMAFVALLADRLREREDAGVTLYVDELNSITSNMMTISALFAKGSGGVELEPFNSESILVLERSIDRMQSEIADVRKFTIPGGNSIVSMCHVCRTICRRAERSALRANIEHGVDETSIAYLNRLSDYFYLLGRRLTEYYNVKEILWEPK